MLRNKELDEEDAKVESRWIRQEAEAGIRKTRGIMTDEEQGRVQTIIADMAARRGNGEPLQYILGNVDFGPLDLLCRPPTLIPRPETADVTTRFAESLPTSTMRVLDLCTGSGCIPLLLAHMRPKLSAVGLDISEEAIALANDNVKRCDQRYAETGKRYTPFRNNVRFGKIDVFSDDALSTLRAMGRFDAITANPPYITAQEYATLPRSVRDHEDPRALLGSTAKLDDGLAFYRRIAQTLPSLLRRGPPDWPCLMLEIGATQGEAVKAIMQDVEVLGRVEIWDDMYGRPRGVVAWRKGEARGKHGPHFP